MATTCCETTLLRNKTANMSEMQFENHWLSRCPKSNCCVFDQGDEFPGKDFVAKLCQHGIHTGGSAIDNPQSKAACKPLRQSIDNALRAPNCNHLPDAGVGAAERIGLAPQSAVCAAPAPTHSAMKESQGSTPFHRDMLLNIPLIVDFELLRQ